MKRRKFLESSLLIVPILGFPELLIKATVSDMINVLILGDSISIGYTPFVRDLLNYKANVLRPMVDENTPENCEGTTKGVANIDRWIGDTKWDIIHFNFGLHDIKHVDPVTGKNSNNPKHPQQAGLSQYKKKMELIVEKLITTGATLIFATTTPYPDKVGGPLRDPGMSAKYNSAAIKIMNQNKIIINDLYAFMLPRMNEMQQPENVHFTPEGYLALAQKVVDRINDVIRDKNLK